jgi:pilus assembly protein CpaB
VAAPPTKQVLVAKEAIGVGQRVTATAIEWAEWPESAVRAEFVTSVAAPQAITDMEGSVARSEILPGEPILEQKLARPDGSYLAGVLNSGMRGVSVPVTAAAASGGFIAPNDRVDVISTRTLEARKVSDTILYNVRVLAINGQLGKEDAAAAEDVESANAFSGETLATLELDPSQSELVINAMAVGELTLVLRSITDIADGMTSEQRAANQAIRASSPFWTK